MSEQRETHETLIREQFTQQAELFAKAPALHNEEALEALVRAADPRADDVSLDVACGPGTVAVAFAEKIKHATGLDATQAMLGQARVLASEKGITNVSWTQGDVYNMPFEENSFDIVTCRFAFHHFECPEGALSEMKRVCKPGGRVVVCDAVVPGDKAKADAFNAMERFRDSSTVEFRSTDYLANLFAIKGFPLPEMSFYFVPVELETLCKVSFPVNDDYDGLRQMIIDSIEGDKMGVNTRWQNDKVRFEYSAVIFSSVKP